MPIATFIQTFRMLFNSNCLSFMIAPQKICQLAFTSLLPTSLPFFSITDISAHVISLVHFFFRPKFSQAKAEKERKFSEEKEN